MHTVTLTRVTEWVSRQTMCLLSGLSGGLGNSLESETSLVFPQAVNIVVGGEFGAYFQELSPKEHCKTIKK